MDAYRTADERFIDVPGYPFDPRYFEWEGLRMHYIDEGNRGREPTLLLHGEPDWSYLYRRMVPILARRFRVLAPDYLGFGRSDKPTDTGWYSYDRHTESIKALIEHLDVRGATLVVQDWGGPIGLRAAVEMKDRFARLVVLNTGLFGGGGWPSPGFMRWRTFAERVGLDLPVGRVMASSVARPMDDAVARHTRPPSRPPRRRRARLPSPSWYPSPQTTPRQNRCGASLRSCAPGRCLRWWPGATRTPFSRPRLVRPWPTPCQVPVATCGWWRARATCFRKTGVRRSRKGSWSG